MSEVPGNDRSIAGRYRLLGPLGQGGMGVVWRARDEVLGREVAVKEVRAPDGLPAPDVQRLYARLEREAWAAARISHRNVVTVYDVATEDARPWIVMELIRGLSLSDVLDAEGPLTPRRAARIGAEVLAALRSAHDAGVLHRDVKPGNVLLGNDGRVVLTDFGIAVVEGSSALTMTGELIGSPEFLAPERALGRTPGPASDLWSLGVLLYAATEGNSPFRQDTPLSTLRAVVDEEPPPPRRAGPLGPVIEGLLRKDPAERPAARETERLLRVVAAGGTGTGTVAAGGTETGTVAAGPSSPTVTARTPQPARGRRTTPAPGPLPPDRSAAGRPATDTRVTPTRVGGGPLRAGAVAAVLGVAALLAVGGAVRALTADNEEKGPGISGTRATPGATGSAPAAATRTPQPTAASNPGKPAATTRQGGGGPAGGSGHGGTTQRPQSVRVHLAVVRGGYEGSCPPPRTLAPAVTATVTVGRTPARVEYRWVIEGGTASDPVWRSVDFAAGDRKQKQVSHTELTYPQEGSPDRTYRGTIVLEVRSPVAATSNGVEISVTCERETPTDGASHPTAEVPAGE
ncbi:protein kinase [Streptomyces finlayi]|uniref:non-specific serine/threonine protein kinase n=1 Tax=Streptomyces finlayi TaxID=67296 RepID=A0A7G7BSC3_9ACTN|nr:serine/threonine-protein kinase [Streptomyces finlayi]QNE78238.1 protein kinase [Streptomyces finlayi]